VYAEGLITFEIEAMREIYSFKAIYIYLKKILGFEHISPKIHNIEKIVLLNMQHFFPSNEHSFNEYGQIDTTTISV
jgi:HEPN domain-containing protein